MHHVMLAKFKPEISKEQITEMFPAIQAIYENAKTIEGIHDVIYHRNCIDRPNRYDISVSIVMEKEALPLWDACPWHKQWKEEYGDMLEKKCIFDYED
ncbi:MAG: Dabb family protein [Lachnospiraceae bacterium]|nr:Dabb family protein [Lachnospiraceae bacterium]